MTKRNFDTPPLFSSLSDLYLIQNERILDFFIFGKKQYFRDNLGCFRVFIDKRKEEAATLLGMDGQHIDSRSRLLMDNATSEMNIIIT